MTTQQGRDNQSSAGDHRKPRVPSPKAFESAQLCNLARCTDSGKTRSALGHFTLLWCFSKPACRTQVAPSIPDEPMHDLAVSEMDKRTTFFSRFGFTTTLRTMRPGHAWQKE